MRMNHDRCRFPFLPQVCGGNDRVTQVSIFQDLLPGASSWATAENMLNGRYISHPPPL